MRVLTICVAYGAAAIAAVATIAILLSISDGEPIVIRNVSVRFLLLFVLAAASYALPVALPVIIVTEIRHYGDWKIFVAAGAILGVLLAFGFAEVPFRWSNLLATAPLVPIATFAAIVYWMVAWKWMPLKPRGRPPHLEMSK